MRARGEIVEGAASGITISKEKSGGVQRIFVMHIVYVSWCRSEDDVPESFQLLVDFSA